MTPHDNNGTSSLDSRNLLLGFARRCDPVVIVGLDDLLPGDVVEVLGHPEVFVALSENEIDEIRLTGYDDYLHVASTLKLLARPPSAIQDWIFDALDMLANGLPGPQGNLFEQSCWRCKRAGLAFFVDYSGSLVTGGDPFSYPGVIREIRSNLNNVSPNLRLGTVKKRFSRTVQRAYRSQGCAHCDALWGDFPLEEQAFLISASLAHGERVDRIRASWYIDMASLFNG